MRPFNDPEFWVAAAFVLFVGFLIYQGVHRQLGSALDARGAKIAGDLSEAARLRAEAEALLAAAHARFAGAEKDAGAIIEQARANAAALAAKAEADLANTVARRTADSEGRIANAERAAIADLRARVARAATAAAARVIAEDTGVDSHARLADRAIAEVGRRL